MSNNQIERGLTDFQKAMTLVPPESPTAKTLTEWIQRGENSIKGGR